MPLALTGQKREFCSRFGARKSHRRGAECAEKKRAVSISGWVRTFPDPPLRSRRLCGSKAFRFTWLVLVMSDGLWLAYESNASGQYEIYVRPFPNVEDGQWLISRGGGSRPLWAPDGRELFYLAPGRRLMAVPVETVQTEPSFAPGNAEEVFGGVLRAGWRRIRTHLRHLPRWRALPDDQGKRQRRDFLDGVHPRTELVRRAQTPRPDGQLI